MLAYCSLYHDIFNICHKHCLSSEIIKKNKTFLLYVVTHFIMKPFLMTRRNEDTKPDLFSFDQTELND